MKISKDYFSKDYFFGKKLSNYFNYNSWDNDRYWKSIIDIIKRYKIKGRMLDVGCAFGLLLKRTKKYFNEVHGIDISEFAISEAKRNVPDATLKIININNEELPYPDKYFDLITALDVLEHTESIQNSLKKIASKLKDNGYLIISLPLRDTWAGRISSLFDIDKSHISIATKKELFEIFDRLGLKIIDRGYFLNMIYFKIKGMPVCIELVLRKK